MLGVIPDKTAASVCSPYIYPIVSLLTPLFSYNLSMENPPSGFFAVGESLNIINSIDFLLSHWHEHTTHMQAHTQRLFQASRKGVCAIARASPWTPTTPLLKIFGLAPLSVRFDLKFLLLTHRCVHSIASPLLCRQYKLRTQANSTYRTTRGQTLNSLCLPLVTRRSGELTPLYTSTLLYNNLPSELRSPNISFSLFHCTIMKYLGHPVRRP